MKVRRTIPPAGSPVSVRDLLSGLSGMLGHRAIGEFEDGIREHFGARHVFLMSSGKAALSLILSGLHAMTGRKKVVIPAYTCYSVPSAVVRAGLDIVLCDLSPETLDFDYEYLEDLANREVLCIVSTHLFGIPADVSRVRALTEGRGIHVVEDAAQGMGVQEGGRKLGTLGDAGFFSLGRGKNVTCGSGGIILTPSDDVARSIGSLYDKLEAEPIGEYAKNVLEVLLMTVFIHPGVYWLPSGMPFLGIGQTRFDPGFPIHTMNGFKAGLMRSWASRLEASNGCRASAGEYYMNELGLRNGRPIYSENHPFLRFPFYGEGPELKEAVCRSYGHLGISPMYPDSINNIEALRGIARGGSFPGAEAIARTLLTLPTHARLATKDRSEICRVLEHVVAAARRPAFGRSAGT